MFKYVNVRYDSSLGLNLNSNWLPEIIDLFLVNEKYLFDDYYENPSGDKRSDILEFINALFPHFWVVLTFEKSPKFVGFIYLDDWKGCENKLHSCFITTAAVKAFWGEPVFLAGLAFIDYIVKTYRLKKVKAEVFENNLRVRSLLKRLGFVQEATLKSESFKNKKPLNTVIYSFFTHYLKEI